jgi:hypothetical protein
MLRAMSSIESAPQLQCGVGGYQLARRHRPGDVLPHSIEETLAPTDGPECRAAVA